MPADRLGVQKMDIQYPSVTVESQSSLFMSDRYCVCFMAVQSWGQKPYL